MTQLSTPIMALQPASKFAAAYQAGIHKSTYWEPVYEAPLPAPCAPGSLPHIRSMR